MPRAAEKPDPAPSDGRSMSSRSGPRRRPYLAGDALTLADFFVAPMLPFLVEKKGGGLSSLPTGRALAAWLER